MEFLKFNKPNSSSWKDSYKSLYSYLNIMLYYYIRPVFLRKKSMLVFFTRAIRTFLPDSDEAPCGGKGTVIPAVGGAAICVQGRREKPPQDRQF